MSYKETIHSRGFFLIKFEEHRFSVRRGIALFILQANISIFFRELRFGYTDKCIYRKLKTLIVTFLGRLFLLLLFDL